MCRRSFALLLLILPLLSDAWSQRHPWDSFGGFSSRWPDLYDNSLFDNSPFDSSPYNFGTDLYDNSPFGNVRRAPSHNGIFGCPAYKRLHASEWQLDSAEQELTVDITLPDIIQQTVRATLDDDSSVIRVKGLRERTAHRSCLPEAAKITKDGRHEVLETTIAIPNGGIAESARMKTMTGGVRLYVPFKAPCSEYEPVRMSDWKHRSGQQLSLDITLPNVEKQSLRTWLDVDKSMIRIEGLRSLYSRGRDCLPEDAKVTADGRHEVLEVAVPVPKEGMMQKWSAKHVQGGLRLSVPLNVQRQSSPQTTPQRSPPHSQPNTKSRVDVGQSRHPIVQPLVDIVVEDVPYDWPEKDANAAEGYVDARGDFYEY